MNISLTGEAVAVESHFDIQPPQQVALFKALQAVVLHLLNRLQTAGVQLIFLPVIERQRPAQHFGGAHHVQEPGAEVAQYPPVETVFRRRVNRQRGFAEVLHRQRRLYHLLTAVKQRALQRPAR
ncbi:hypothetical protein D3C76_1268750 [compost metagenome]